MRKVGGHAALAGLLALALSGCDVPPAEPPVPPKPRPPGLDAEMAKPAPVPPAAPSAASEELAFYYQRVQQNFLAQELLRVDGGGVDTAYTDTTLARNFEAIVFSQEPIPGVSPGPGNGNPQLLQKWVKPVRIALEFSASVPQEARDSDEATVRAYAARLSRIARHPVSYSAAAPNFHVLVMGEDDRETVLRRAQEINPNIDMRGLATALARRKQVSCFVFTASSASEDYSPDLAIAVVRSELPALMRKACYHEELAQGMGLANDSPSARPSIFNDDEEFALLTTHDEELLRLLYDPRLTPGMSMKEARPVVQSILAARGGPS